MSGTARKKKRDKPLGPLKSVQLNGVRYQLLAGSSLTLAPMSRGFLRLRGLSVSDFEYIRSFVGVVAYRFASGDRFAASGCKVGVPIKVGDNCCEVELWGSEAQPI